MSGKITLLYENHGIKLWKDEDGDKKMFWLTVREGDLVIFTENGFHDFIETLARIEKAENEKE